MTPHLACPMREQSQIGDARRQAARLAAECHFDEVAAGRLALLVTELATNLVRHARDGSLLIGRCDDAQGAVVELLSLDHGPGIADVENAMSDGVSTFGSPGTGLGAVRRLANECHVFSKDGVGTVIVVRVAADAQRGPFEPPTGIGFGAICLAAPGEQESGDAFAFRVTDEGAAVIVADGLGHGVDAAVSADAATRVFHASKPAASAKDVLEAAHAALRGLRGAAVAMARIDPARRRVSYCGAGNISGRVISGAHDKSLMSHHGTIGLQVRRLSEIEYDWPPHAILVLHSDGIASRWDLRGVLELLACAPIVIAAWLMREHLRGRDDATIVVMTLAAA